MVFSTVQHGAIAATNSTGTDGDPGVYKASYLVPRNLGGSPDSATGPIIVSITADDLVANGGTQTVSANTADFTWYRYVKKGGTTANLSTVQEWMPSAEFTSGWQGTYAAANGFHRKDGIFKVTTSGAGGTFLTEDFRISSGNNKIIEVHYPQNALDGTPPGTPAMDADLYQSNGVNVPLDVKEPYNDV